MNTADDQSRLHRLLAMLLSDSLNADEHAELQRLLTNDPVAQQTYFVYIDVDTAMRKAVEGIRAEAEASAAAPPERLRIASRPGLVGATVRPWRSLAAAAVLLAAATAVIQLASHFSTRNDRDPRREQLASGEPTGPVRRPVFVTQAAGAQFLGAIVPPVNTPLTYHEEYVLTSGMLELTFPNGAEVILESPCVMELAEEERLVVRVGSCSVHAPPGAEGFRVTTPETDIVDLGTRFAVAVSNSGETDVHVVEGAAEIAQLDVKQQAAPVTLREAEAARFAASLPLEQIVFETSRYRDNLPDRVVSYAAKGDELGNVDELTAVTVQRGGVNRTYRVDELIGVKLAYFHANVNGWNTATPLDFDGDRLATIESDALLNTGITNPGGSKIPLDGSPVLDPAAAPDGRTTPGMAFTFNRPVINGPGPDMVLFELQFVLSPPEGDVFHVSPLSFREGLRSHSVETYDITMRSPEARRLKPFQLLGSDAPPRSLTELLGARELPYTLRLYYRALAVGIDFSDLGYAEGEPVEGVFIQDSPEEDEAGGHGEQVDPTFVAGFPAD